MREILRNTWELLKAIDAFMNRLTPYALLFIAASFPCAYAMNRMDWVLVLGMSALVALNGAQQLVNRAKERLRREHESREANSTQSGGGSR